MINFIEKHLAKAALVLIIAIVGVLDLFVTGNPTLVIVAVFTGTLIYFVEKRKETKWIDESKEMRKPTKKKPAKRKKK